MGTVTTLSPGPFNYLLAARSIPVWSASPEPALRPPAVVRQQSSENYSSFYFLTEFILNVLGTVSYFKGSLVIRPELVTLNVSSVYCGEIH